MRARTPLCGCHQNPTVGSLCMCINNLTTLASSLIPSTSAEWPCYKPNLYYVFLLLKPLQWLPISLQITSSSVTANRGSFPLHLLSLPCSGLATLVFPQFLECFKLLTSQDPHPTGFGLDDTPLNHFPAPLIWIRSLLQYLQWWRRALRTNREVTINFPNPLILYFKIGNWLWNLDGSFILIMTFNLLPGVWKGYLV